MFRRPGNNFASLRSSLKMNDFEVSVLLSCMLSVLENRFALTPVQNDNGREC